MSAPAPRTLGWGGIARLCLTNMAIGALAALPVNLFNRLMTVELAWPAILPGLLVALHYGVQLTRPSGATAQMPRAGARPSSSAASRSSVSD